jgi:hypothetical protein
VGRTTARRARRALLVLTAAASAAGCGGGGAKSDPDAIAAALHDAAEATAKGDGDKACSYLTEDAQRQAVLQLRSAGGPGTTSCSQLVGRAQFFLTPLDKQRIENLKAADVSVNGTNASATLRGEAAQPGQAMIVSVNLAKLGGDWKISGFGQASGVPGG